MGMSARDMDSVDRSTTRRIPHYAQTTISSSAPEYSNHEQDVIRQSFCGGNHTWMKDSLPVELQPDSVNLLRRRKMERNRLNEPMAQTWSKMSQTKGKNSCSDFIFMPDPYNNKNAADHGLRATSLEKRAKISHQNWRNVSQEKRMKYEAMISEPHNKETYPYLGGDKDEELEMSKHWLRIGGTSSKYPGFSQEGILPETVFLAGKGRGLDDGSRSSRMTLPLMVQRLQARLDADWDGTTVIVSATDQDLVQVAFHMATVDSERGVLAYMSVLAKDVDLIGSLGLRKLSQLWGMRRDFKEEIYSSNLDGGMAEVPEALDHTWMFFLFVPKWVRMRPTDAYYTVHPRSQGSAFRMSTAGSSVLLSLGISVTVAHGSLRRNRPQDSPGMPPLGQEAADRAKNIGLSKVPAGELVDLSLVEKALSTLPIRPHEDFRQ